MSFAKHPWTKLFLGYLGTCAALSEKVHSSYKHHSLWWALLQGVLLGTILLGVWFALHALFFLIVPDKKPAK
jgi:hypothetical protein